MSGFHPGAILRVEVSLHPSKATSTLICFQTKVLNSVGGAGFYGIS
jgi:hypothetical protein